MTVPHCIARAKERYGIELTRDDVASIEKRCKAGEGLTGHQEKGSRFHAIIHGERVLWAVYMPPEAHRPDGTLVTVMPAHIGATAAAISARHKDRRLGQFEERRRKWR